MAQQGGGYAAEAVGPGAAQELHDDGFGLVVKGVRGGEGVGAAFGEEVGKGGVTEGAGGFFEAFAGLLLAGCGVDVADGEGNVQAGAEIADEGFIGVGLGAAQAVVDVDGGENEAQGLLLGVGVKEGEQEGGGVGPAGEREGDTLAGVEEGAVEAFEAGRGHQFRIGVGAGGWYTPASWRFL